MSQLTIKQMLELAKINFDEYIDEDLPVLQINGTIFGSLGNFSLLTGRAKSKKTFSVTLAVAAALGGDVQGVITGSFPENKRKVVIFDTEQSRGHVLKLAKRVCHLIGEDKPENLEVFALREFGYEERMEMILTKIEETDGLGLVVIDGARDLVSSINSEEEATKVSQFLMTLSQKHGIHIITVLHQNKGSDMIRGHIGTELQNKAETVAEIRVLETNINRSNFQALFTKNSHFEGFQFYVDEDGIPFIDAQTKVANSTRTQTKQLPGDYPVSEHVKIIGELDKEQSFDRKSILMKLSVLIKEVTGTAYGEKKVGEFVNFYVEKGYLAITGTVGTKSVRYRVNPDHEEKEEVVSLYGFKI